MYSRERVKHANDNVKDAMAKTEFEARKDLEKAIEKFVKTLGGPHAIATDFTVTVASADLEHPAAVTTYWEHHRGPMHSLMGLNHFERLQIEALNAEELG